MNDLIGRQKVLNAILQKPAWHNSDGSFYHADDIKDAVNATPSSPSGPQIIYCKDCKYRDEFKYCTYKTRLAWIAPDNDYCSRAERK